LALDSTRLLDTRGRSHMLHAHPRAFFFLVFGLLSPLALGQSEVKTEPAVADSVDRQANPRNFKLSLGHYIYSDGVSANDLNLRWFGDNAHVWVGRYNDHGFGIQNRAGLDYKFAMNERVSLQVSGQTATGGFYGGSVQAIVGDALFATIGLGRTNLKPYYNLNFDPNDSVTIGGGTNWPNGSNLSLTVVADNRTGSGQKVWHLVWRDDELRDAKLIVDLNYKQGVGPDGRVHGWGFIWGYEYRRWFLKMALDKHQNFENFDAVRLTAGLRF
jgi:hypothetical protein